MSNWLLCLPCSILFIFSKRKCISKSWRKLMNYKPENRIPWPFTDFEKFVFPWLFPDRGNPAVTSQQISPLPQIIEHRETSGWFEFKCGQPQDIIGLLFLQSGVVRCFCWGTCKLQLSCQCTVIKVFLDCYRLLAFCFTVCVRYPSPPKYKIHDVLKYCFFHQIFKENEPTLCAIRWLLRAHKAHYPQ